MHNPDKINLIAGNGIQITGNYPNLTISSIPSFEIVYAELIRLEGILPPCSEIYPMAQVECIYFNETSIVELTLKQDDREPVCKNFYLTGKFEYNIPTDQWVLLIYLWGDLTWDRYDVFVRVTNQIHCREGQ